MSLSNPSDADAVNADWVQTGVGTVTRTLDAKLREGPLTPKDFGAIGDGVADDTAPMQALFAAAQAQKRPIYITGGTNGFRITDSLVISRPGVRVKGDGDAIECPSKIIMDAQKHCIDIRVPDDLGSNHFIEITDLFLRGPGSNVALATCNGLNIGNDPEGTDFVDEVNFARVRVYGFYHGAYFRKWSNSYVQNCCFEANRIGFLYGGNSNANLIMNSWFGNSLDVGIVADGTSSRSLFVACEGGNQPKMARLINGGMLNIRNMSCESFSGSPLTGDADCVFEVNVSCQLFCEHLGIGQGGNTSKVGFKFKANSGGALRDCKIVDAGSAPVLAKVTSSSGIPITYTLDSGTTTFEMVEMWNTSFSSLLSTYYANPSVALLNGGMPTAAATRRGVQFTRIDNAIGDCLFICLRAANGTFVNAPLTPTMTGNTWQSTQTFAIGAGLTLNGSSGATNGGITWLNTNAADRRYMLRNIEYLPDDIAWKVSTGDNNPTRPFFYYRGSTNRLTIGHIDDTSPTGVRTLNVEGTIGSLDDIIVETAGKTIRIKEGTNAKMGQATLVAGAVTIATTAVTANSRIQLTRHSINGSTAIAQLTVGTITPGTSFVINARKPDTTVETNDVSIVNWLILEPA